MRRITHLALAVSIAAGAAVTATGCASQAVHTGGSAAVAQHKPDALSAKILKIAEDAAQKQGGADPKSVQYVRSTRAAANKAASGDIVVGDQPVYLIEILGTFHDTGLHSRPMGVSATPTPFTCITLIVDAETLGGLDGGSGTSQTLDLASLGPVTTAL